MTRVVLVCGVLALLVPTTAHAEPFGIEVISATYSATLTLGSVTNIPLFPYQTTTVVGSQPVSLAGTVCSPVNALGEPSPVPLCVTASASADWLAVSDSGFGTFRGPRSFDSADFALLFSPVIDGIAPMEVHTQPTGFSHYSLSFFDLTANHDLSQELWAGLPVALSAAHVYDLHLSIRGSSDGDGSTGGFRVSGLTAVPEPSSLLLLGSGLAGLGTFRRRTRNALTQRKIGVSPR